MDMVDLAQLMNQHRPFTMFYSTQSILQSFNDVEKSYLVSQYGANDMRHILHYLIIPGDFYAKDFVGEKQCKIISPIVKRISDMLYFFSLPDETIGGESLTVSMDKEHNVITVNGQRILQTDILAANGKG